MKNTGLTYKVALVEIMHPVYGNRDKGRSICDEVREKLKNFFGKIYILHDATAMKAADAHYASAFRELYDEMDDRVAETVCAIPSLMPRIMANTVSRVTRSKWAIYKSMAEAEQHLKSLGMLQHIADASPGSVQMCHISLAA